MRFPPMVMVVSVAVALAACGGMQGVRLDGSAGCGDGCGDVRLTVSAAKSFDASMPYGRISLYRVSISGPGIDGELVAEFPGDAEEGVIEGVPAGSERTIAVSAINEDESVIRAGEAPGIAIEGGGTADVEVTLESVPIFLNLHDGSIAENTRLIFRVFAEPPGPIVIDEFAAGDPGREKATALVDAATSVPEIVLDNATGVGRLAPVPLNPGEHTFVVRNAITGRSSTVQVRLLDGTLRHGAPLFAGGDVMAEPAYPARRLGEAWAMPFGAGIQQLSDATTRVDK